MPCTKMKNKILHIMAFLFLLLGTATLAPNIAAADDIQTLISVKKRPPALDFKLMDLNGRVWRLSDMRGKVIVLNFCGLWAPPCRKELPALQKFWQCANKFGVQVLVIDTGDKKEREVREFVKRHNLKFPVLLDPSNHVSKEYGVNAVPVTFVLDTEGKLAYVAYGNRNWMDPKFVARILALHLPK